MRPEAGQFWLSTPRTRTGPRPNGFCLRPLARGRRSPGRRRGPGTRLPTYQRDSAEKPTPAGAWWRSAEMSPPRRPIQWMCWTSPLGSGPPGHASGGRSRSRGTAGPWGWCSCLRRRRVLSSAPGARDLTSHVGGWIATRQRFWTPGGWLGLGKSVLQGRRVPTSPGPSDSLFWAAPPVLLPLGTASSPTAAAGCPRATCAPSPSARPWPRPPQTGRRPVNCPGLSERCPGSCRKRY
mmetsp:Transcript_129402/g.295281  ORF Transcript_129402/g.295281 Transcript_129402/m.295281 type:complete len:237 (+) Transcript_129402:156-866(+)